jgi:hypothetical protein
MNLFSSTLSKTVREVEKEKKKKTYLPANEICMSILLRKKKLFIDYPISFGLLLKMVQLSLYLCHEPARYIKLHDLPFTSQPE